MDNETAEIIRQRRIIVQILAMSRLIMLQGIQECIFLYASRFNKVPQHTSILSDQDWITELIAGHNGQFHNEMGMNKHIFWKLLSVLRTDAGLLDTRHVSSEEQVAIFLHYVHRGLSNCALQEQFQRSPDTISK
jgi:hypothetical protein